MICHCGRSGNPRQVKLYGKVNRVLGDSAELENGGGTPVVLPVDELEELGSLGASDAACPVCDPISARKCRSGVAVGHWRLNAT
jgi:hypothetical protein